MDPENFKWPPVISGPGGAVLEPGGRGVTPRGCRQGGRRGFFLNPTRLSRGELDPDGTRGRLWREGGRQHRPGRGVTEGPSQAYRGSTAWGGNRAYLGPAFSRQRKGLLFPGCSKPAGRKGEKNRQPGSRCRVRPSRGAGGPTPVLAGHRRSCPCRPHSSRAPGPCPGVEESQAESGSPRSPRVLLLSPSPRPARHHHAGAGPWRDRGAAAFAPRRCTGNGGTGFCSVSKAARGFIMLGAHCSCG